MLPNISLNNLIDTSAGVSLLTLSVSGLMCTRGMRNNQNTSENACVSKCNKSCSSVNFNLGLSSLGVTGALLLYRGLRH